MRRLAIRGALLLWCLLGVLVALVVAIAEGGASLLTISLVVSAYAALEIERLVPR